MSDYAGSVLVSSAGRRVQLVRYFQRALADLGIRGKVITTDMNPDWSAASRLSDAAFKAPRVSSPEYAVISHGTREARRRALDHSDERPRAVGSLRSA